MAITYFRNLNERLRRPGGPPFYFRITNIIVAVLMIVMGIVFFTWSQFGRIMLGIYEIVFAIWMILFELAELAWLTPLVQFMFTWRGRGLFYVFIGCLTLGYRTVGWVFGAIIIAIGVVYIVLSFTTKRNECYLENTSAGGYPGIANDPMYNQNNVNSQKIGLDTMYGSASAQYAGAQPQYGTQTAYTSGAQPQPQYTTTQYSTNQYASGNFDASRHGTNHFDQPQPISPTYKQEPRTDRLHSPI
ncbi:hypothetical protein GGI25_004865 [Coemansia spiralis]|uniref:COPI associated protein n=2 Tax=Coemansia TaxID=4863 RepID=A0A9W8FZL9_9FUNG|nr:COPI associated protein-domain-containing protein [Coemansia spiralis]KAJ1991934.1 hypothetical protein EDC05_003088 [Coemansia umbellata]KAJ2625305.1 hypothetical protein GGI26_000775 [Coemansia sp. RSA 1358]KAJ2673050.1 hypothetical protein GGI25_004865 [Coemansia spiralis]